MNSVVASACVLTEVPSADFDWTPFGEQLAKLNDEQRLHFCELLAHELTVVVRTVWSGDRIDDAEKVDRMKWINELLHRVTARVRVLRLKTHEWTEADFGDIIRGCIESHRNIASGIDWAMRRSYRSVVGEPTA